MYSATDVIWVLAAAILVFFMQAGFALCEAGLTRAKNTGNILMKNMKDFCIGSEDLMTSVHFRHGVMRFFRLYSALQRQRLFPVLWQSVQTLKRIVSTAR